MTEVTSVYNHKMIGNMAETFWETQSCAASVRQSKMLSTKNVVGFALHDRDMESRSAGQPPALKLKALPFALSSLFARRVRLLVDRRGVEPRFPGCKPSVLPLDEQPVSSFLQEVRPGIEPGLPLYHSGVQPKHLQTIVGDPGWS